jgi:hypothetical protein
VKVRHNSICVHTRHFRLTQRALASAATVLLAPLSPLPLLLPLLLPLPAPSRALAW